MLRDVGASLAITHLNEKARPYVEPLAGALGAELFPPLDVRQAAQMATVFAAKTSGACRLAGAAEDAGGFGPADFHELLAEAELAAPERDLVDILDVGAATAFLYSQFAKLITGGTIYVDEGHNIRG